MWDDSTQSSAEQLAGLSRAESVCVKLFLPPSSPCVSRRSLRYILYTIPSPPAPCALIPHESKGWGRRAQTPNQQAQDSLTRAAHYWYKPSSAAGVPLPLPSSFPLPFPPTLPFHPRACARCCATRPAPGSWAAAAPAPARCAPARPAPGPCPASSPCAPSAASRCLRGRRDVVRGGDGGCRTAGCFALRCDLMPKHTRARRLAGVDVWVHA